MNELEDKASTARGTTQSDRGLARPKRVGGHARQPHRQTDNLVVQGIDAGLAWTASRLGVTTAAVKRTLTMQELERRARSATIAQVKRDLDYSQRMQERDRIAAEAQAAEEAARVARATAAAREHHRSAEKLGVSDPYGVVLGQLEETGKTGDVALFKDAVADVTSVAATTVIGGPLAEEIAAIVIDVGTPALTSALRAATKGLGEFRGDHAVYFVYGEMDITYVGISRNFPNRYFSHGRTKELQPFITGLSQDAARGVEQVLIEIHGFAKHGGSLSNKINSVSNVRDYPRLVALGKAILGVIGWPSPVGPGVRAWRP